MAVLDILIVIVYFVVIITVGVFASRRAHTSDDYLLAGRRLGFGFTFSCLCAVLLGGASTIGTVTLGYTFGISGIWLATMLGLGLAFVGVFLICRIYESRVLTIAQLLSGRFGNKAGILSALVSALYTMMVCATQIIAMGTIMKGIMAWDAGASMLLIGGIVVLYTILGGMWAITLTDFVQFILIVIGIMFVMLFVSVDSVGGLSTLLTSLPSSYFNLAAIGWQTIVQYFLLYCLGAMVGQDIWQRFLTAKSVKVARYGGIAAGIFAILYSVTCALVGMCAQVVMPGIEDTQLVFILFAQHILPSGLLGIVLAAVMAVLMSTASGTLLASASLLSNDVIAPFISNRSSSLKNETAIALDRRILFIGRATTAAIGVLAIIIAVALNNILAALDVSYAILSGALFFPIILGLFWKKASANAAIISIVASSVVILAGLLIFGTTAWLPIVLGLVVSFVLIVGISLREVDHALE